MNFIDDVAMLSHSQENIVVALDDNTEGFRDLLGEPALSTKTLKSYRVFW